LDLIDIIQESHDIILLKARQLGWTWLLNGFGLWKCLFTEAAKGLFISQKEEKAWEMVANAKSIWEKLPDFLRASLKHDDNRALLDFTTHKSLIQALPSTRDAGRGTDASFVFRDELATHPFGRENFTAVGPTIDSGGLQVDLSTIDKSDATNHFTERINRAKEGATRENLPSGLVIFRGGESGATLVFGGWKLRPVREEGFSLEDWFESKVKPKYTSYEIEEQYPETIEQALSPIETRPYFDIEAVEGMLADVMEPLFASDIDTHNGMVKVYKLPLIGRQYCVFTDPSEGTDDPFHTVVIDAKTYEGVAEASGKVPVEICAQIHHELAMAYNKASQVYEANSVAGGRFGEILKLLKTPNLAPRRDASTDKIIEGKRGWWTSESSKRTMLQRLSDGIHKRQIICHNKESIEQFRRFFIPAGEKPRMPKGLHDDALMAWAGAYSLTNYITRDIKISSWKYD